MEDDNEKSQGKPESIPAEDSFTEEPELVNEASNGLMEEGEGTFAPSSDFEESNSQQTFQEPAFDNDDATAFQDTLTNDGDSIEAPHMISDFSQNGDSSNMHCRESSVHTQQVLQDMENSLEAPLKTSDLQDQEDAEIIEKLDETNADDMSDDFVTLSDEKLIEINTESDEAAESILLNEENVLNDDDLKLSDDIQNISDSALEIIDEVTAADEEMTPAEETATAKEPAVAEKTATPKKMAVAEHIATTENAAPAEKTVAAEDTAVTEHVAPAEEAAPSKETAAKKKKVEVVRREVDTEVVSEDELPGVNAPSVQDAENVSDDELPAPKPAELPADTEVVSEDELPTNKREEKEEDQSSTGSRKRKPDEPREISPASQSDPSSKKQAVSKNGESKPVAVEKRPSEEKEKKKKALPELEKYWKVVKEDSSDFTGWTYLLQYVDQENDVEAARVAYDAFLSHYPYCYGYWRKYADYEKRKGSKKKCNEVLERGLKAIPLSVDLWIHYLNHVKSTRAEDLAYIRQQYDRAIEACGLEFRSDRLWESYIKWETENGTPLHVTNVYDRLLATPTLGYTAHFDNFQEHIMSESVSAVVPREEIVRLRIEVREGSTSLPIPADLPPGEDEPEDHIASEEEGQAIKERIIALRRKVHKATGEQVTQRWTFEEGIKRPYFHVKPLERSQLKNWKSYLEWEKQHGSFKRALVLHERCLIACALYQEFWLRLVKFLEEASQSDSGLVSVEREVLERACTVHHPDKPTLHLHWAYFEEINGNAARAAEILEKLDKKCPNLLMVAYRRVNLERRRGDIDKCCELFNHYISTCKSKVLSTAISIKYARFVNRYRKDTQAAQKILADAIAKDPLAHKLYLQQLDVALHTPDVTFAQISGYLEAYERVEGAELDVIESMSARRFELAEDLGSAEEARDAHSHHKAIERRLHKRQRQNKHDQPPVPETPTTGAAQKKKDMSTTSSAPTASAPPPLMQGPPPGPPPAAGSHSAYYPPPPSGPPQGYEQPPYQQQYQAQWNYQQHPPNPYHPNPWGQYPNYY